jgi:glycine/serine hydroxymethyltransferase
MDRVGDMIVGRMVHIDDPEFHAKTRVKIKEFCEQFPLYAELTTRY